MTKANSATTTAVPATAPGLPAPSGRRLLAGSGLAAALATIGLATTAPAYAAPPFVPAMSPDHPDAEVIAACMAFEAVDRVDAEMPDDVPDVDFNARHAAWYDALNHFIPLRPRTLIGAKAKASAIIIVFMQDVPYSPDEKVEDRAQTHELAAWRLLHDILLLGVGA